MLSTASILSPARMRPQPSAGNRPAAGRNNGPDRPRSIMRGRSHGAHMHTRQLGQSDLDITPIGLGAWAIGGAWRFGWGPQDDGDSIAAIRRAVDHGINWIDTAPAYGLGRSESVVGQALADIPAADRPYVFTKCSLVWDDTGTVTHSLRPDINSKGVRGQPAASGGRAHRPLPDPLAEVAKRARRLRCRAPGRCMAGDERPAPRGQGGVPRCVELRCRPARARACDCPGHEPAAALLACSGATSSTGSSRGAASTMSG